MKRIGLIFIMAIGIACSGYSQGNFKWTAFIHQAGMYYTSDRVTSDGFGLGAGVHVVHKSQVAGQADVNILWGNGNAITTRLAVGYERKGSYAPGVYGTLNLIWGQRIQMLSETGENPPLPSIAVGIRVTPIKFITKRGYISALEFGYGFGPDKAMSLEVSILSVGIDL